MKNLKESFTSILRDFMNKSQINGLVNVVALNIQKEYNIGLTEKKGMLMCFCNLKQGQKSEKL